MQIKNNNSNTFYEYLKHMQISLNVPIKNLNYLHVCQVHYSQVHFYFLFPLLLYNSVNSHGHVGMLSPFY